MSRVTVAVQRKAKKRKLQKQTKGFIGGRRNLLKAGKETLKRAMAYSYRDRKVKKRTMRALWILRISIASKENGCNYSQLINGLTKVDIKLNRKILADLAVNDKNTFKQLTEIAIKAV